MASIVPRLVRAWLDTLGTGLAEFDRDWPAADAPAVRLSAGAPGITAVEPASPQLAGRAQGYVAVGADIWFMLPIRPGTEVDPSRDRVFVAGDFNGWLSAVGRPEWEMTLETVEMDTPSSLAIWSIVGE